MANGDICCERGQPSASAPRFRPSRTPAGVYAQHHGGRVARTRHSGRSSSPGLGDLDDSGGRRWAVGRARAMRAHPLAPLRPPAASRETHPGFHPLPRSASIYLPDPPSSPPSQSSAAGRQARPAPRPPLAFPPALLHCPRPPPSSPTPTSSSMSSLPGLLPPPKKKRNPKALQLTAESLAPPAADDEQEQPILVADLPVGPNRNQVPELSTSSAASTPSSRSSLSPSEPCVAAAPPGSIGRASGISRKKPMGLDISKSIPTRPAPVPGTKSKRDSGVRLSSSSKSDKPRGSYQQKLSEQLVSMDLGGGSGKTKKDLRTEDLKVVGELGSGNGGTVAKVLHVPSGLFMARKVSLCSFCISCSVLARPCVNADETRSRFAHRSLVPSSSSSTQSPRSASRSCENSKLCTTARATPSSPSTAPSWPTRTSSFAWNTWTEGEGRCCESASS